jgi:hypothetical protein
MGSKKENFGNLAPTEDFVINIYTKSIQCIQNGILHVPGGSNGHMGKDLNQKEMHV